ncbi:hypothetical protein [Nostoc sp.]|uniref:hypothetical protein n=1 Tax=Nostoc sp. TaxID=1180 RepID=UPI002FFAC804
MKKVPKPQGIGGILLAVSVAFALQRKLAAKQQKVQVSDEYHSYKINESCFILKQAVS